MSEPDGQNKPVKNKNLELAIGSLSMLKDLWDQKIRSWKYIKSRHDLTKIDLIKHFDAVVYNTKIKNKHIDVENIMKNMKKAIHNIKWGDCKGKVFAFYRVEQENKVKIYCK